MRIEDSGQQRSWPPPELLPRSAKQHNAQAVAQAGLPARAVDGKPAVALAKRMGFEEEYLMCWTWVFPEGVNGNGIP